MLVELCDTLELSISGNGWCVVGTGLLTAGGEIASEQGEGPVIPGIELEQIRREIRTDACDTRAGRHTFPHGQLRGPRSKDISVPAGTPAHCMINANSRTRTGKAE
jgi:hypothetical protein